VTHNAIKVGAAGRVGDKHHTEKISSLGGNVFWEGEGSANDVLVEKVDVVAIRIGRIVVKGEVAGEHGIENDATAPDVDGAADIEAFADD
jgi:hypothetical protein